MTPEPTPGDLTRGAELCWFDDTVTKHPGEVTLWITRTQAILYDFAQAVRFARSTGTWRGRVYGHGAWDRWLTRGEWAVAVVQAEVDHLRKQREAALGL